MPSSDLLQEILSLQNNGFLSYEIHTRLHLKYNISYYEIEKLALSQNIVPYRYKRNSTSITPKEQLKLLEAKVAIVGCGGLGGNISEYLARVGVGNLLLMDFDTFDEHNLNRQNYSNVNTIGKYKVDVAKEAINKINPSVQVFICKEKFNGNFEELKKYDVIVDALDNPKNKLLLAKGAKKLNISFVHGAIGGFITQVSTNSTLENIYRDESLGSEIKLGNLPFIASYCASIQANEVIKIILKKGELLKDKIMMSDLFNNEFFIV